MRANPIFNFITRIELRAPPDEARPPPPPRGARRPRRRAAAGWARHRRRRAPRRGEPGGLGGSVSHRASHDTCAPSLAATHGAPPTATNATISVIVRAHIALSLAHTKHATRRGTRSARAALCATPRRPRRPGAFGALGVQREQQALQVATRRGVRVAAGKEIPGIDSQAEATLDPRWVQNKTASCVR